MFSNIAKDAGESAAKEFRATASETLDRVAKEVVPGLETAAEGATDHATYALAGIVADIANRLNGSELPVDIEINVKVSITGKIGALKISKPEYEPQS